MKYQHCSGFVSARLDIRMTNLVGNKMSSLCTSVTYCHLQTVHAQRHLRMATASGTDNRSTTHSYHVCQGPGDTQTNRKCEARGPIYHRSSHQQQLPKCPPTLRVSLVRCTASSRMTGNRTGRDESTLLLLRSPSSEDSG